jgi:mannose/fructose/N-acetylgalactosamine-specific phosphotransferase system component IID
MDKFNYRLLCYKIKVGKMAPIAGFGNNLNMDRTPQL